MWIIRCARACRRISMAHPAVKVVAAAPVLTGFAAAAALLLAPAPPKPALACGCDAVWVPRRVYVSPQTARELAKFGDRLSRALWQEDAAPMPAAPFPAAPAAPGGATVVLPPHEITKSFPAGGTDVPEPGSIGLLAIGAGLLGLLRLKSKQKPGTSQ